MEGFQKIAIIGTGKQFAKASEALRTIAREAERAEEIAIFQMQQLAEEKLQCEMLGISTEQLQKINAGVGVSCDEFMKALEQAQNTLTDISPLEELAKELREPSVAELKRRLKHAKNPMEIKALNRQISGRKRKR